MPLLQFFNAKKTHDTIVVNDTDSILSFFISAKKGGWNGKGQYANSCSTTPYAQDFVGHKDFFQTTNAVRFFSSSLQYKHCTNKNRTNCPSTQGKGTSRKGYLESDRKQSK